LLDAVFVGRANVDLTVRIQFRPTVGRTAFGSELMVTAGGKSFNQAIAVSRLGGRTALVANAGADQWGNQLLSELTEAGVDTTCFRLLPGVQTGAAIIEVTPDGENFIVLALTPAAELTPGDVGQALIRMNAPVIVVQLDIPPEPVSRVLTERLPSTIIGNLVPNPAFDRRLLSRLDFLVVNQQEAATMLATPKVDALDAAQQLRQLGPSAVVVTAGARGAAYSSIDGSGTVAAEIVPVVDTTGAGDAFLGCLALGLSRGVPLSEAVARSVRVGTEAVQYEGAQLSPRWTS
jgi:ribokinase